jgi:hypothetical protein
MRIEVPEMSLGVEAEALLENTDTSGGSTRHEQYSITPLVGARTRGSVYHPNLLAFDLNGEAGWGWLHDSITGSGPSTTRDDSEELLRYLASVNIFSGKPYNATLVFSRDHTYQDIDVFNTYTVDSKRNSGVIGVNVGDFSLNLDGGHRDETSEGISSTTRVQEYYLNFNGDHKRQFGQTGVIYRYDQFETQVDAGARQDSVLNAISATDSETFGSRRQINSTLGAGYSQYEYSDQQIETVTANEYLTVHHREHLDTYLNVDYSQSDQAPTETSLLKGETGVRHQLYESLSSKFDVHGSYDESSSPGSWAENSRYGIGINEDYRKRLSTWGRLSLGAGFILDHEDHESSGTVETTFEEPHQLYLPTSPNYRPEYLDKPNVILTSVQVIGPNGIPATLGADYILVPAGQLTEIRLVLGSVILNDGDTVRVNYQSESLYNAAFESFNTTLQIRLDLFECLGIYARANWLDNNAPPNTVIQTLTDYVLGVDYTWRWLRTGAEYEDYDSNFNEFTSWRFFQSFNFRPDDSSTFSVDFTESFYRYPAGENQDQYQFITRYHTRLPFALAWYVEGGYNLMDVLGSEQNYGFARTGLTWSRGKLSARASYDYNYQTTRVATSEEVRNRHQFLLYLKRTF